VCGFPDIKAVKRPDAEELGGWFRAKRFGGATSMPRVGDQSVRVMLRCCSGWIGARDTSWKGTSREKRVAGKSRRGGRMESRQQRNAVWARFRVKRKQSSGRVVGGSGGSRRRRQILSVCHC
jgi:hypothetical protein